MSDPKFPAPGPAFITGWALETAYPAGANAWNGQPCKTVPVGDIFIPGTPSAPKPVAAEWLNYLFNQQGGAIQALQVASYLPAVQNWHIQAPATNFTSILPTAAVAGAWLDATSQWLLAVHSQALVTGEHIDVYSSGGMDGSSLANWTLLRSTAVVVSTNVAMTTNGTVIWLAVGVSGSGGSVVTFDIPGSDGTTFFQGTGTIPTGALVCALHTFQGTTYCGISSTSQPGGAVANASGGVKLPISGHTMGLMLFADNSGNGGPDNLLIVCPTQVNTNVYWTSPDATTWTQHTLPFNSSSGHNAFGLVWTQDAVGPCWLLGVNHGTIPEFFRSADGITWTFQSNAHGLSLCTSMASFGSVVYCAQLDASSAGPSGGFWSIDGGATWYRSQDAFSTNLPVGLLWTPKQAVANFGGFMLFNSLWLRFGDTAGLPYTSL